jgi:hypothetical protein
MISVVLPNKLLIVWLKKYWNWCESSSKIFIKTNYFCSLQKITFAQSFSKWFKFLKRKVSKRPQVIVIEAYNKYLAEKET